MLLMCHLVLPRDSKRHPLNSADGSAVRNTKRYTLAHHVATATTLITIRGIRRHGKLKNSDYGLLAQFGLTPKSRRGLAAGEALRREEPSAVLHSVCLRVMANCSLTPIRIKHAAALAALIRLFTHRIIDRHGEQLATVRALNFRGAGDGSREAEFVVDEVVGEGH